MSNSSSSSGTSILGMLGVLFVGLKLGGIIDWSWWLVLLPFWGGLVLIVLVLGIVLFATSYSKPKKRRYK